MHAETDRSTFAITASPKVPGDASPGFRYFEFSPSIPVGIFLGQEVQRPTKATVKSVAFEKAHSAENRTSPGRLLRAQTMRCRIWLN